MLVIGLSLLTLATVPEPHFEDTPFARAVRMIEGGRTAEGASMMQKALAEHPDAPESPKARFVLGLALMNEAAYEEAAELFDDLAQEYPLLSADHQYYRGRALFAWGNFVEAADALAGVDTDSPWGAEAESLRAWAFYRATDFEKLVQWAEELEGQRGPLSWELAMLYGRALGRTAQAARAATVLERVWYLATEPKVVGWALSGLVALENDAPKAWRGRAGSLGRRYRSRLENNAEATLDKLEKRLRAGSAAAREIALARGRIAEARGRLSRAVRAYRRALGPRKGKAADDARDRAYRVASLGLGRIVAHGGDQLTALAHFNEAADGVTYSPEAEEARFRSAEILVHIRRYDEARERCEAILFTNPVTDYRRRCLWTIGWAQYRAAEYAKAKPYFAALLRQALPAELDGASRYWMGRCLAQLGKGGEAEAIFTELVRRYPLSFYAALADAQLSIPLSHEEGEAKGPTASDGAIPKELELAREYLRLGLKGRASEALESFQQKVDGGLRLSARAYAVWAAVLDRLRERLLARKVREAGARAYPGALSDPRFLQAAQRAHPLEFEPEIRRAARRFGIPASLLFALVRTESGFKQHAVSAMRAYGLAQLILPTAQAVGRRLRAGPITRSRLLRDAGLNVRLGAAYLRELLDRYDGSEPLALAAYNAGPVAVDAWMRRRVRRLEGVRGRGLGVGVEADELAEEIPVAETRAFVKAVLSRSRAYAYLYGRRDESQQTPPPAIPPGVFIVEPTHLPAAVPSSTPAKPVRVTDRRFVASSALAGASGGASRNGARRSRPSVLSPGGTAAAVQGRR